MNTLTNTLNQVIEAEKSLQVGLWVSDVSAGQKWLAQHDADRAFTAASTIKLAVYLAYIEKIKVGKVHLTDQVTLKATDYVAGAGAVFLLKAKPTWTIWELLTLMIAVSDNTATNVLIMHLGLAEIQKVTRQYQGAQLERLMMEKVADRENILSAKAAGQLLTKIFEYGQTDAQWLTPFYNQQFREGLPGLLDEVGIPGLAMANKTGRLNRMEHDVCLFQFKGRGLVVACFTEDLTGSGRGISLLRKIGACIFDYLQENPDI